MLGELKRILLDKHIALQDMGMKDISSFLYECRHVFFMKQSAEPGAGVNLADADNRVYIFVSSSNPV